MLTCTKRRSVSAFIYLFNVNKSILWKLKPETFGYSKYLAFRVFFSHHNHCVYYFYSQTFIKIVSILNGFWVSPSVRNVNKKKRSIFRFKKKWINYLILMSLKDYIYWKKKKVKNWPIPTLEGTILSKVGEVIRSIFKIILKRRTLNLVPNKKVERIK